MPMIHTFTRTTTLALLGGLSSLHASAADLNARDFFGAPSGTSLGVLYLPASRASDFHGPADGTGKADLKVNAVAYRQVFFTDLCGTLCTPQFIVPFADINARLPVPANAAQKAVSVIPRSAARCFSSTIQPRAPTAAY